MRHAVVDNETNEVVNVILWDREAVWAPPEGTRVLICPDHVGIGWTRVGSSWEPPAE